MSSTLSSNSTTLDGSQLFIPFRSLGYVSVCGGLSTPTQRVPMCVYSRGKATFIAVTIGKTGAFQIYDASMLRLLFVAPPLSPPQKIVAMTCHGDYTFTAVRDGRIVVWRRAKELTTLQDSASQSLDQECSMIIDLLIFGGGSHLISISNTAICSVWDLESMSLQHGWRVIPQLPLEHQPKFEPTIMMHPATYLNKILIGSMDGRLVIVNIKTQTVIYTFAGWGSAVLCAEQSPAVDVIGIGLMDGRIVIHNIKTDTTIMTLSYAEAEVGGRSLGRVTSLSFRTDGVATLVSGSSHGDLVCWDLNDRRVIHIQSGAHIAGSVASTATIETVKFIRGQPLVITNGCDNAIKMWIFDSADGSPRLLKFRSGHSSPITRIRYYSDHRTILSCSEDRSLRVVSTISDHFGRAFSQGSNVNIKKAKKLGIKLEELRLPPITSLAWCSVRERDPDWVNVLTCHMGSAIAHTWRYETGTKGKHELRSTDGRGLNKQGSVITAVSVSVCGNFGFIGSQSGCIDKYNIQSGIHRATYWVADDESNGGHTSSITGLEIDALNMVVISSSLDGYIKFWHLHSQGTTKSASLGMGAGTDRRGFGKSVGGALIASIHVGSCVTQLVLHRESGLLAVASDDLSVRIYDSSTRRLVRLCHGHCNRIADLCFSPDARWLVTACLDGGVRVWDLPSARLIDWFKPHKLVVSLSFSPTGEFLATAHVNSVGVFLWANRSQFQTMYLKSLSRPLILDTPHSVRLPSASGVMGSHVLPAQTGDVDGTGDGDDTHVQVINASIDNNDIKQQLGIGLVTLSGAPATHWLSLANLDLIKERNRPSQPPKAPETAPFFLPTLPGVNPVFVSPSDVAIEKSGVESSDIPSVPPTLTGWESDGDGEDLDDGRTDSNNLTHSNIKSRIINLSSQFDQRSLLQVALDAGAATGDWSSAMAVLLSCSASGIDVAFRSLLIPVVEDVRARRQRGDSVDTADLGLLLKLFISELESGRHFEVINAYLCHILKLYGPVIIADRPSTNAIPSPDSLWFLCSRIRTLQSQNWERLEGLMQYNCCLISYFTSMQVL